MYIHNATIKNEGVEQLKASLVSNGTTETKEKLKT